MNVLVDTNILGRLMEPGHPHHRAAGDAVDVLIGRGDSPCLVPQVCYEFWVVVTRPLANNGLGFTAARAGTELSRIRLLFPLLPDLPAVFPEWERLVTTYSVTGKPAHDTRLVAAMIVHGLTHVLPYNGGDFSRFAGITVLDPVSLASSKTP